MPRIARDNAASISLPVFAWATIATCAVLVGGCSGPKPPDPASANALDQRRLAYVMKSICLPVYVDHVDFTDVVSSQHLTGQRVCGLEACYTLYCSDSIPGVAGRACAQEPDPDCHYEVRDNSDFAGLTATLLKAVTNTHATWHAVRSKTPTGGYTQAYCNADNSVMIEANGFVPGQSLGTLPGYQTPGTQGLRDPVVLRAHRTELDIRMVAAKPGWCVDI